MTEPSLGGTEPTHHAGGPRRRLWWVLGGIAGVIAVVYVAGWYFSGDRVPKGTTVAGVDIGGLSASGARERLEKELGPSEDDPVSVTAHGVRGDIRPDDIGMFPNYVQTADDAGAGRSWNPVRIYQSFFGGGADVELAVEYDAPSLTEQVAAFAARADRAPVDPSVTFGSDGTAQITQPVVGLVTDRAAAAEAIVDAYLSTDGDVELPTTEVLPAMQKAAFQRALRTVVEPATSGPVTLQLPGRTARLGVEDFAPALSYSVSDRRLKPEFDVAALEASIAPLVSRVGDAPRDATVKIRNGAPAVVPGRPGVEISADEVAAALIPVLKETGEERRAEVGQSTAQPDFTTRDAKALRIKELVGEFVTYFPYAEYRNTNQGRAAELINGTVLKPGDLFSFNGTVGERTEENGFVVGFIIQNGVFAEDLGGGVSQVVTTTYNAAFFAGMDDVEHKPHSFYIDRYPMGREATVAWPSVDLKFRNSTPYGVLIEAWVVPSTVSTQGEMHVRMWSTKYWDITAGLSSQYNFTSPSTRYDPTDDCVATTGYGGFDVDVTRTFRRAGSDVVDHKETKHVTYIPADTVICSAPPGN